MPRDPVGDAAARQAALDVTASCIVRAPAGSGKTTVLTQRVLALLATVDAPEELVALTFTRKAADEMRDRVLQALADARAGVPCTAEHEQVARRLADRVLERDHALGWHLAASPGRLRVHTFDALAIGLAAQLPLTAQLGRTPAPVDDAGPHYRAAAQAVLALLEGDDPLAADVACLLQHLDLDHARAAGLLADLLRKRDQWLRLLGLSRAELEEGLASLAREALADLRQRLPAHLHDELVALARHGGAYLRAEGRPSPLCDCADLAQLPDTDAAAHAAWCGLAELLLTAAGTWRAKLNVQVGFPAAKAHPSNGEWLGRAARLLDALRADEGLAAALAAVRTLPPPGYTDGQWQVLATLARLLPRAVAELRVAFAAAGECDFLEFTRAALDALGDPALPSDLALALDARLRHLLVDEFQDTSLAQFALLEQLVHDWTAGDGRTLFLVGDPMQSIYRFRDAEVALFLRAWQTGVGPLALRQLVLSSNFRSQGDLVAWFNAAFERLLPASAHLARGAVPFERADAALAAAPGPAVSVHAFAPGAALPARAAEAARVVDVVRAALAADDTSSIAVLVRARTHLADIVPALRAAGIGFTATALDPLAGRPAIVDLLALLRALLHRADRVAWLAVLRAPWCGLTLADLAALAEDQPATVCERLHDDAALAQLSADGRARVLRVRAVLDHALALQGRAALRDRLHATWLLLGGPATLTAAAERTDVACFFDHLGTLERCGNVDAARFEASLQALYAAPDPQPARVELMTVHKAKGLEFDHVIVPGLDRQGRRDARALLVWQQRPLADGSVRSVAAPIESTGADNDPACAWIRRLEDERGALELQRLLYVAATRARRRLHWMAAVRHDSDGNLRAPAADTLLNHLWPVLQHDLAAAVATPDPAANPSPAPPAAADALRFPQTLWRLPAGWAPARLPPPVLVARAPATVAADSPEFSWAGQTARVVGVVVHRWLQAIADDGLDAWSAARIASIAPQVGRMLEATGLAAAELTAARTRVLDALAATLADPRGRWMLGPHPEAASELRLTMATADGPRRQVIDRTLVDAAGTRWIIDFKTGTHDGGDRAAFLEREAARYRPQLEGYAQALDPNARLALFYPLLPGWWEWRAGQA